MKLLVVAGERCERLLATKIRNVPVVDVQCDEIWTFCYKKEARCAYGDRNFPYVGDAWTFIAVERNSKLVLAFDLGKRTTGTACRFTQKIAVATSPEQRFQLTTDGFAPYNYAVGTKLENRCDYAQLVKICAAQTPEEQRRYSPSHVVEAIPTEVYGDPERNRICTSHIERLNGSLRQWCKRLTRLTYAFSKKWEHLRAALALHFAFYNFCRVHGTLRQTPATKAGITDHTWSLTDLLTVA
jgi:IS1 family transposase